MKLLKYDKAAKIFLYSIIWASFSSCVILLLINLGIKDKSLFALKDLVIYLLGLYGIAFWIKDEKSLNNVIILIIFCLFLFFNYLLLNPVYDAPIGNIRQIIAPLIFVLIYSQLIVNKKQTQSLIIVLLCLTIFIFVFGIFEEVFELWPKVNLQTYFTLKGIPVNDDGLSYMFYEPMFNYRERMTSTLLDPISLGHFFASFGILLFYLKRKSKLSKLAFICCLIGLILALSKGAIMQFLIGCIILNSRINNILKYLFIIVLIVVITNLGDLTGILIHINGFVNSIKSISFWGYGIGSVGNYAKMFSDNLATYNKLKISDTYVGSLIGQIGLLGTSFWVVLAYLFLRSASVNKSNIKVASIIFFSIFSVAILSENTMNVTSFLLPCIIMGISINLEKNKIYII